MAEFTENKAGVHVMNPIQGEYSLCGDAFDINSESDGDHDGGLARTQKKRVTCERCKEIILELRNVRVG